MKKAIFAFLAVAALACASVITVFAAKRGKIDSLSSTMATKTMTIEQFTEIETNRVNVELTPAAYSGQLKLTAPDNIINYIDIKCRNGKLSIKFDEDVQYSKGNIKATVYVSAPCVNEIEANLAAVVNILAPMSVAGDLEFEANTAATISADKLKVDGKFSVDANTAANINATDVCCTVADFEANTAANIKIAKLSAKKAKLEANTSGNLEISAGSAPYATFDGNTAGTISAAKFVVESGSADASTGGTVKCHVKSLSSDSSTGGKVKNNR